MEVMLYVPDFQRLQKLAKSESAGLAQKSKKRMR
jgi:hypothetical protein